MKQEYLNVISDEPCSPLQFKVDSSLGSITDKGIRCQVTDQKNQEKKPTKLCTLSNAGTSRVYLKIAFPEWGKDIA